MSNYSILHEDGEAVVTLIVPGDPRSPFMARDDHPNFKAIVGALISDDDPSEIADLFDVADTIATKFQRLSERVTVDNGQVKFDGVAIDSSLAQQIMDVIQEGGTDASWKGLVAFMENVYTNPDGPTATRLFDWLKAQDGLTITEDGLIVGYKKVQTDATYGYRSISGGREPVTVRFADGTEEVFTGKIPNPLGATVEMPRNLVNPDANQTCSVGLHVGAWGYMGSFSGSTILEVHVNPRDVRSVPVDYDGQKVRTCRYKVIGPVTAKYEQAFKAANAAPAPKRATAPATTPEDLDLTLAPLRDKPKIEDEPFAVGDRVLLVNEYMHFKAGTTGVVKDIGTHNTHYKPFDKRLVTVELDGDKGAMECYAFRLKRLGSKPLGSTVAGGFRIGQEVVLVEPATGSSLLSGNKVYTVTGSTDGFLHLEGVAGGWYPRRFKPAGSNQEPNGGTRTYSGATSQAAKGHGKNPAQDAHGKFSSGRPGSARDPKTGRFIG